MLIWLAIKTVEVRITKFSLYTRPFLLVLRHNFHSQILTGSPLAWDETRVTEWSKEKDQFSSFTR